MVSDIYTPLLINYNTKSLKTKNMNFFTKYKKIFLVIGFLLVSVLMGYLNYVLFFKSSPQLVQQDELEQNTTGEGLPSSNTGSGQLIETEKNSGLPTETNTAKIEENVDKIAIGGVTKTTKINNVPSLGANLNANGSDLNYYNKDDGKFYRIDDNGNTTTLSDKVFYNVSNVTWSKTSNKAILEYPDGANIVYDFDTKKQITLPSHWKDFDFSPNGDKIISKSMAQDPDNRWLIISNDNGSNTQALEHLGTKDSTVYTSWSPSNSIVAMFTESKGVDRQEVYFVGQNHENLKSTTVEGRGFDPQWSKDGDKLLYSVYSTANDLKPSLWIVNAEGDSIGSGRKNLNIDTWASKCTFYDNTQVFCAVPEELEEGSGLFPELAESTTDNLYKIDTRTGLKKLIAIPDGDYNMSDLIVSENGYHLYFTDTQTGNIHKIDLK